MKVAILGAGSWGTALASAFVHGGTRTVLWARNPEIVQQITNNHMNPRYLPDAHLSNRIEATTQMDRAIDGAEVILFAVPSAYIRPVMEQAFSLLSGQPILCHAVKGFDATSGKTISDLMLDYAPDAGPRIGVLAGPTHAEEVVAGLPTTIVAAAYRRSTAELLQDLLMAPALRVYTNPDVKGAELGGALKNIIALGVGIADGLGFGDNARAALMTRGLTEITRLGVQLGASVLTFSGLSGVGDLIVTCTSRHSRNYRAGKLLGQGVALEDALQTVGMAVEGISTTRIAVKLARDVGVEMPISESISDVLFDHRPPRRAVEDLMSRAKVHEMEEVASHQIFAQWGGPEETGD